MGASLRHTLWPRCLVSTCPCPRSSHPSIIDRRAVRLAAVFRDRLDLGPGDKVSLRPDPENLVFFDQGGQGSRDSAARPMGSLCVEYCLPVEVTLIGGIGSAALRPSGIIGPRFLVRRRNRLCQRTRLCQSTLSGSNVLPHETAIEGGAVNAQCPGRGGQVAFVLLDRPSHGHVRQ